MGWDSEKAMPWKDPLASAILMLLLGLVLIVLGRQAVQILVVAAGVLLMIYGSVSLSKGIRYGGTEDAVKGLLAAVFGLVLAMASGQVMDFVTVILGAVLVVIGVVTFVQNLKSGGKRRTAALAVGAVLVIIGVALLLLRSQMTEAFVMLAGALMMVAGAVGLYAQIK